jgi:peroxiredoxin
MNRRQTLALWGAGAVAAAAGAAWFLRQAGDADRVDDGFWALRFDRPEGGELAMATLRGRVLVLNFWATWCPPCIKELPEFNRLHQSPMGQNLQVVGLAIDGPTPVRQFLARQPVGFPVGLAGFEGTDLSRQLGNATGALPFTVVLDRQGKVRHRKLGPTDFDELSSWVKGL